MMLPKRLLRYVLYGIAAIVTIVLAAAILIQSLFAGFLKTYALNQYGWILKIGSAELQFSPLSVRLNEIEISSPGRKPFLQARSAYASLPYSSFWGKEFVVNRILADSPRLN